MNTNKSPGNDCIINEYITSTIDIVLPIYVTLFNIIFDTGIIKSRLTVFSDEVELLDKNQSGFRQGYSTIDNIFVLHILLELLKGTKKNMYCAFIDFEKAFDSVWRIGRWQKLLSSNINGKCFRIIFMCDGIRSRIVHNGCKSEYFQCNIGVRQGESF